MKSIQPATVLTLLAFAPAPLAAIGGRCNGSGAPADGICIDRDTCRNRYGGQSYSEPYCPSDVDNIECCVVLDHCPGKANSTGCTWNDRCTNSWGGSILEDPVCPGGDAFVCCDGVSTEAILQTSTSSSTETPVSTLAPAPASTSMSSSTIPSVNISSATSNNVVPPATTPLHYSTITASPATFTGGASKGYGTTSPFNTLGPMFAALFML